MRKANSTRRAAVWPFTVGLTALLLVGGACSGGEQQQTQGDFSEGMAKEHAGDRPVGSSLAEPPPAGLISEQRVSYATIDGETIQGFFAEPADARGDEPGVIVIHEWWGLNDNIETMTRKLAAHGYQALAVDLYGGRVATEPGRARELMEASFEQTEKLKRNLRQGAAYLQHERDASRLGVLGWCFGGGWSLRTGLMLGDQLDAVVVYYGRLVTDPDRLEALEAPLLGIFGEQDQGIPVETVRAFEAELRTLDKRHDIKVYPEAGHAFANPSGTRFEPKPAEDAWDRTLTFLDKHLRP